VDVSDRIEKGKSMELTIDKAVSILQKLEAVVPGVNPEYARGMSEGLAFAMNFRSIEDAASALLTLAVLKQDG
jgi:hypothetical protein